MRTVSSNTLALRYAAAQRVVWLLDLAQENWVWRGATRAVEVGDDVYSGALCKIERWSESAPDGDWPGGRVKASARVRLVDDAGSDDALRRRLALASPVGLRATLRLGWLGDSPLVYEDLATMVSGRVSGWEVTPAAIVVDLIDELESWNAKHFGRLLHTGMIGGEVSASLGRALQWVFGKAGSLELMPLRSGATSLTRAPLASDSATIPMTSSAGFPSRGRAQVGSEIIEFDYCTHVFDELGSLSSPVRRGRDGTVASIHLTGTPVRIIPEGGFTWLAADHPCVSVGAVKADGVHVGDGQWTTSAPELDGQSAQIVTMPLWPANTDGAGAARITADVSGLPDGEGALIENPADVMRTLLTHARFGGVDDSRLDGDSFANVRATLAAAGYRFARVLTGEEMLGDVIDAAAREAGLWLHPAEPMKLIAIEPSPWPVSSVESLDERRALTSSSFVVRAPGGLLPPDGLELTAASGTPGQGRPSQRFPPESAATSVVPLRLRLSWLDLRVTTAAGDLGAMLWSHFEQPLYRHEQRWPLGAALLRAGEVVNLGEAVLQMEDVTGWLREIALDGGAAVRATATGPWVAGTSWRLDALNFIRRYGFGDRMDCVLGGRPVARINRKGVLRLRGTLAENAAISAGPFEEAVAVQDGKMFFCTGAAGTFTPFMSIDADGNAALAGTVREASGLPFATDGQSLGASATRFWLSPDAQTGCLEYRTTGTLLHLAGQVIEGVRL